MRFIYFICILCTLMLTYINISSARVSYAEDETEIIQTKPPVPVITSAPMFTIKEDKPKPEPEIDEWEYLGEFLISHYTPAADENGGYTVTSTGDELTDGIGLWCAANVKDIPIGATVRIEGYGELLVNDTGIRQGVLDVLVSDKKTAFDMGIVSSDVWMKKE